MVESCFSFNLVRKHGFMYLCQEEKVEGVFVKLGGGFCMQWRIHSILEWIKRKIWFFWQVLVNYLIDFTKLWKIMVKLDPNESYHPCDLFFSWILAKCLMTPIWLHIQFDSIYSRVLSGIHIKRVKLWWDCCAWIRIHGESEVAWLRCALSRLLSSLKCKRAELHIEAQ